ncbi:MAG: hypothetical protein HOW73_11105 [Polyangiaceae bacterium]|nr:hypothetical protein [Polyangiaceae bacterium]
MGLVSGCGDSGSDSDTDGEGGDSAGGSGEGAGNQGAGGPGPSCSPSSEQHEGEATYYDFADGSGNCSFPATPDDLLVGAMNHADYAGSAACGTCAEVSGPNGSVTVRVVDQCPECPQGDIDLSPEAFEQIAALEAGRVPIQWRYVACDVDGPIVYHFKEGSNPWWVAIQIRNHRTPIQSVEAKDESGNYVSLVRADYNFFLKEDGLGEGPFSLRVTDTLGEVLEDTGIALVEAGDSPGAAQFGGCIE